MFMFDARLKNISQKHHAEPGGTPQTSTCRWHSQTLSKKQAWVGLKLKSDQEFNLITTSITNILNIKTWLASKVKGRHYTWGNIDRHVHQ